VQPVEQASAGGFESLIARNDLGLGLVLASLLVAMFWGAAHALTPGHGKAIVAGYLVGTRGKPRDAVLLGLIVTATHTAGVFALGVVTLGLSQFVVPERLCAWLTVAPGLPGVGLGAPLPAGPRTASQIQVTRKQDKDGCSVKLLSFVPEEGDRVPADARFLQTPGPEIDESLLTGEPQSLPATRAVPTYPARADGDDLLGQPP